MKALLLDLDGTLCQMDRDLFEKTYFKDLALYMKDILDPQQFLAQLIRSVAFMVEHPSMQYTCMEVFCRHFASMFGLDEKLFHDRLLSFYTNEFGKYDYLVQPIERGKELIALGREKGLKMAVASNSIMPQIAIIHRLHWAGLETSSFEFISGGDFMHYTKPHAGFYREIASALDVVPEDCLMVGNGKEEDLVAHDIGMATFFVDGEKDEKATWFGNIDDLIAVVSSL